MLKKGINGPCSVCSKGGARLRDPSGKLFCSSFCHNFYHGIIAGNIEEMTLKNNNYREVIATTDTQQLVLMSITPEDGNEIERETHKDATQFIRIERGNAMVTLGKKAVDLKDGGFVVIPPGTEHYVRNTTGGGGHLKLYTIYSPPQHPVGKIEERRELKREEEEERQ